MVAAAAGAGGRQVRSTVRDALSITESIGSRRLSLDARCLPGLRL